MYDDKWQDLFLALVEAIDRLTDQVKEINVGLNGLMNEVEFLNETHIDLLNHFIGGKE